MRLGAFLGVVLKANPYFLLLIVVLAAVGKLPEGAVLFGVVLLHEVGHVVVARRHGVRVDEIELLPFGGVVRMESGVDIAPDIEPAIALAGPATNLLLVGGALLLQEVGSIHTDWIPYWIRVNAAIGLVNLIPALPLDGGRIYRAWLMRRHGYRVGIERAVRVSKALAVVLVVLGVVGMLLGLVNITLLVLGAFVFFAAAREAELAPYVWMHYLTQKREEWDAHDWMEAEQLVAHADTRLGDIVARFVPKRYHVILVLGGDGRLVGIASEAAVIEGLLECGPDTPLADVVQRSL